jgi:hypothetical protein
MSSKVPHPFQWMVPDGMSFEEWERYETSGALNIGFLQSGRLAVSKGVPNLPAGRPVKGRHRTPKTKEA